MVTDGHTDTQTKYCNPRCACAPRVNNGRLVAAFGVVGTRVATSQLGDYTINSGASTILSPLV